MDVKATLHHLCVDEIFPAAELEHIRIHSYLLFGSRAEGKSHKNSDIDAIVVVEERSAPVHLEFHGARGGLDVDLLIFDRKALFDDIESGTLTRALSLSNAIDLNDNFALLNDVKIHAESRIEIEIEKAADELRSVDYISLVGQLEHQMNNYNNYFNSERKRSTVVENGRLFESVSDYLRCFVRLYCINRDDYDAGALKLLICIENFSRNSCYMEALKYDFFVPVTELIGKLNTWNWHSIKATLNQFHLDNFRSPLFNDKKSPQDLLLFHN